MRLAGKPLSSHRPYSSAALTLWLWQAGSGFGLSQPRIEWFVQSHSSVYSLWWGCMSNSGCRETPLPTLQKLHCKSGSFSKVQWRWVPYAPVGGKEWLVEFGVDLGFRWWIALGCLGFCIVNEGISCLRPPNEFTPEVWNQESIPDSSLSPRHLYLLNYTDFHSKRAVCLLTSDAEFNHILPLLGNFQILQSKE